MATGSGVQANSPQGTAQSGDPGLLAPVIATDRVTIVTTTLNGAATAGSSTFTVTAVAGLVTGAVWTILDGTSSERVTVDAVNTVSGLVTLAAPLVFSHANTTSVLLIVDMQAVGIGDPANPTRRATLDSNNSLATTAQPGAFAQTTGTLTAAIGAGSIVSANLISGSGQALGAIIGVNGTYAGAALNFEASDDNVNWYAVDVCAPNAMSNSGVSFTNTTVSNQTTAYMLLRTGFPYIRLRCSALTSGTCNVRITPIAFPFTTTWQTIGINGNSSGSVGSVANNVSLAAGTSSGPYVTSFALGYGKTLVLGVNATSTAAGTLTIQQSFDGVTWYTSPTTIAVGATGVSTVVSLPPAKYVRLWSTVALTAVVIQAQASY